MSSNPADLNLDLTAISELIKPKSPDIKSLFVRPLSQDEKACADLEVKMANWSDDDLATAMHRPLSWLDNLRSNPEYQKLVSDLKSKQDAEFTHLQQMNDDEIASMFNSEIGASLRLLTEIRDNPGAKDSDRLKATSMILDLAPKTPVKRSIQQAQAPNIVINIPYQQVETLKQAALDINEPDLIELLK